MPLQPATIKHRARLSCVPHTAEDLERCEVIPVGSLQKLRKDSKRVKAEFVKPITQLENALQTIGIPLDSFSASLTVPGDRSLEHLTTLPVITLTTDEDKKQSCPQQEAIIAAVTFTPGQACLCVACGGTLLG